MRACLSARRSGTPVPGCALDALAVGAVFRSRGRRALIARTAGRVLDARAIALCRQRPGIVSRLLSRRKTALDLLAYDCPHVTEDADRTEEAGVRMRHGRSSRCPNADPETAL